MRNLKGLRGRVWWVCAYEPWPSALKDESDSCLVLLCRGVVLDEGALWNLGMLGQMLRGPVAQIRDIKISHRHVRVVYEESVNHR